MKTNLYLQNLTIPFLFIQVIQLSFSFLYPVPYKMSAGSQQNFRKAIAAIKDSTSVAKAKVNSEYKELNVSILKATNHVEVLPKEKHVRNILGAVSGSRPRADVAYCIHTLTRRLAKTGTWVVALKTLIVIHRALREVDHSFCEELIYYNNNRGHMFNLLHFKDDSSPNAWDYSTWIRSYALYIEECLECFCVLNYDFHRDHSRTKKFDTPALLEQLPALQQLLFRLLACEPVGAARYNFMIQYALSIVAAESVRLYVAITDGVLVLVDKYFEMQRHDAVRALDIYRKSQAQAQRLSEFFEMCRSLDFGRQQKYVKIEQPPASFLASMEEYVKEAPQSLMLPWRANDDGTSGTPKLIAVAEANSETDSKQASTEKRSVDSQENTNADKSDAKAAPLIPDLLTWDEPSQEAPQLGETNSDPFSITTPELSSDPTISSESSSQGVGWELALVPTPDSNAASVAQNKGGVLDRSMLDSLYNVALTQTNPNVAYQNANPDIAYQNANPNVAYQNTNPNVAYQNTNPNGAYQNTNPNGAYETPNVSSNPFEADVYANQDTFYTPTPVGNSNFMQVAETTPQQQAAAFTQQQNQSLVAYDYMQMAGLSQQQPALTQPQDLQQNQSAVAYNHMQIAGVPQQQQPTSMDNHQQQSTAGIPQQQPAFINQREGSSVNPFDLGPLPGLPQSVSSNLSLL
ncbi:hypothetical protein BUALT_Bualt16G0094900 [Buddleja alternifolia]|uniref:ENTH domain-containing protein n=1 Tax=Buddleja alternifolia TaxID=168488 RepID=A0AAV6WAF3_9LAMI|nr:hypothetical protein BUALT_Bualt16G0094900 [Buddleja alternifolia]